jgi:hypothetical protein
MAGVAAVLAGREAEAEPHLRAVADSRRAPDRYRAMALQGLMGVYLHQGRVPDAIEAALRFEARDRPHLEDSEAAPWFEAYFTNAWLLDLPYLLDFQASEDDLRTTLARLDRGRTAWISSRDWERPTSRRAQHVVTYALAVRLAQREEYSEAARLYARVNANVRARRMKEAARLHAAAQAGGVSPAARLEARYRYAAFLAEHSTQVFFDDLLWTGYQRYALLDPPPQDFCERVEMGNPFCAQKAATMLAPEARAALVERERQVRDAQEERWRAYLLLDAVVREAGPGELARRAARKAVEALDGINTERFGREPEVEEARRRLARAALS